MKNRYHAMTPVELNTLNNSIQTAVAPSPTSYGTTTPILTALQSAVDLLDTSQADYEATKTVLASAKEARDTDQANVVSQIAALAKVIYAKAGLTPAQIAATGLAVRDATPSSNPVNTPTNFTATPSADGQCKFKWNRNENGANTIFSIQSSVDGEQWTTIFSTTKTSATMGYFNPGDVRYFRVTAQRGNEVSWPTETTAIYLPSSVGSEFSVAA